MANYPIPIYIFHLPRSGSTLLQRLLATHEQVATASESHLLLPFLTTLQHRETYSLYNHDFTVWAIKEFYQTLPGKREAYLAEIRELILRLYSQAAGQNKTYFVDKAAAYHLILEEIFQLFPEAKFIFLWRNPLAVISSIMNTWNNGRWNIFNYDVRLFDGLPHLISAYQNHSEDAHSLKYEDLIQNPESEMAQLFDYLELSMPINAITDFARVELAGRTGDMEGMKRYNTLSNEPLSKWEKILGNPLRKLWCRRYLKYIGKERLAAINYSLEEILAELQSTPMSFRYFGSDILRMPYGFFYRFFDGRIVNHKIKRILKGQRVYAHK